MIFAIITDQYVGGTFLSWSLHYLGGNNRYFLAKKDKWIDLCADPVTNTNAHNFVANHPNVSTDESELLRETFKKLKDVATDDFHTIYFHRGITEKSTIECVTYLSQHADKVIIVSGKKYPLYHCKYERRASNLKISSGEVTNDPDTFFDDFVNTFFKESLEWWNQIDTVWDKREFIALNFDHYKINEISSYIDFTVPHYYIDGLDLWMHFDQTVDFLLNYLGLKVTEERLKNWKIVYSKWKQLHHNRLLFVQYFDNIIDYIINNYNMDLERFNLDIFQEAAIQRELLYKHNLNLKIWQLEKFKNTKQLHNLLEPNIHHELSPHTPSIN